MSIDRTETQVEPAGEEPPRPKLTRQEQATADLISEVRSWKLDPDRVAQLLADGADPRAQTERGVDALMAAAMSFTFDREEDIQKVSKAMRMLLDAGADPLACGVNGLDALMRAASRENAEFVQILAPKSDARRKSQPKNPDNPPKTAFQMALGRSLSPTQERRSVARKAKMLAALAPLSDVAPGEWSEMAVLAAVAGEADLLRLCAKNCDVKSLKSTLYSETPEPLLIAAVSDGAFECVPALLAAGCDPDELCAEGDTALMRASEPRWEARTATRGGKSETDRRTECLRLLLPVADAEIRDARGDTALMRCLAFKDGQPAQIAHAAQLLAAKSDPDARDRHGDTALTRALGLPSPIEVLRALAPRADLSLKNARGEDALAVALRLDFGRIFAVCDLLVSHMSPKDAVAASLRLAARLMPSARGKIEARELEAAMASGQDRAQERAQEGSQGGEAKDANSSPEPAAQRARRAPRAL